jgi:hypothetical protein
VNGEKWEERKQTEKYSFKVDGVRSSVIKVKMANVRVRVEKNETGSRLRKLGGRGESARA